MTDSLGVFDMGSNTLSFTAAKTLPDGGLDFFFEGFGVTRLSENLKEGGQLDKAAQARFKKKLKSIFQNAQAAGVENFLLVGTAAFRRAADGKSFLKELGEEFQAKTRLLSGDEEAYYSYVSAQKAFDLKVPGVIDIGGGSTEIILGSLKKAQSLAIGTVVLSEKLHIHDPINDQKWTELGKKIEAKLQSSTLSPQDSPTQWVAVASTPTAIASSLMELPKFIIEKVHGFEMSLSTLKNFLEKIRVLDLKTRQHLPGMDPNRAQLVPIGGRILEKAMEFFGVKKIKVSHHGLRQGILWEELTRN